MKQVHKETNEFIVRIVVRRVSFIACLLACIYVCLSICPRFHFIVFYLAVVANCIREKKIMHSSLYPIPTITLLYTYYEYTWCVEKTNEFNEKLLLSWVLMFFWV